MKSKILMSLPRMITKIQNHKSVRNTLQKISINYHESNTRFESYIKFYTTGKIQPTLQGQFNHTRNQNETVWPKAYKDIKLMNVRQRSNHRKRNYNDDRSEAKWKIIIKLLAQLCSLYRPFLMAQLIKWVVITLIKILVPGMIWLVKMFWDYINKYFD